MWRTVVKPQTILVRIDGIGAKLRVILAKNRTVRSRNGASLTISRYPRARSLLPATGPTAGMHHAQLPLPFQNDAQLFGKLLLDKL